MNHLERKEFHLQNTGFGQMGVQEIQISTLFLLVESYS